MAAATNDDDNNNRVWARCRDCGQTFSAAEMQCPNCGSNQRALIGQVNETERIRETLRRELEREKRNNFWFALTMAVTIAAPFITAFLNRYVGIAVGVGFGLLSFWLGKRAYTRIRRIYESE